jgi:ferric-dicitrate binding protein FerR (iron transport regulator)
MCQVHCAAMSAACLRDELLGNRSGSRVLVGQGSGPVMAEAHHLSDVDRVEREASEWIARLNADEVSDDDRAHCAAWCTAHLWHARTYDEMCATWHMFTAAGPLVRAVALGEAINEAARERTPRLSWLYALLRRVRHGRKR